MTFRLAMAMIQTVSVGYEWNLVIERWSAPPIGPALPIACVISLTAAFAWYMAIRSLPRA